MILPVSFPSDDQVIAEEAARFRSLSPRDRIQVIRSILSAGALMMKRSPKADFLRDYTLKQEELAQQAVRDFMARHGS